MFKKKMPRIKSFMFEQSNDEQKKSLQVISYLIKIICNSIKQIGEPILRWYWKKCDNPRFMQLNQNALDTQVG